MTDYKQFDVIIIGGSYAGLSAAMTLGRSLRNVLIIDSSKPCNRYTPHSQNFITHDGEVPATIAAQAKEQLLRYDTVTFFEGLAVRGLKTKNGFEIQTKSGEQFATKKLLFATGVKDKFPPIKGFEECWGKTVIHCPYCHGYEFREAKTAIMANGEKAIHLAGLVDNLTDKLSIITSGKAQFDPEQIVKLKKHQINIIEEEIITIEHENGNIKKVLLSNGKKEYFTAMYAAIPFEQHSDIPASLGCELTDQGHIKVDGFQKTTLKGVFACGDATTMMRSVSNAVATGNNAGAMLNKELVEEQF